jgi:hypothetical protein
MDGVHDKNDGRCGPGIAESPGARHTWRADALSRRVSIQHRKPQIEDQDVEGGRPRNVDGIQTVYHLTDPPTVHQIMHGLMHPT